jgi:hypothetical protein
MRKLSTIIACMGVLLGGSALSIAQEGRSAPADVPRDHWAFRAVDELFRAGLLRGYPDGTFKGNRPATRYELAGLLDSVNGDLGGRLEQMRKQLGGLASPEERLAARVVAVQLADRDELAAQLRKLQEEVAQLRAQEKDVTDLRARFERMLTDLRSLRRDVDEIRSSIR